jgi:FlaA1/EpsC-like NDP-sugar epimerase
LSERINFRTLIAITHDIFAAAIAWMLAYWLRFNLDIPQPYLSGMLITVFFAVLVQTLIFGFFGLYRGIWRYASIPDLQRILIAVFLAALAVPALLTMLGLAPMTPRSVFVIDPILLVCMMGGSRLIYRAWKEGLLQSTFHMKGQPVLVIGAGDAAVNLLKGLNVSSEWHVVGVLDDHPHNLGKLLHGVKILGSVQDLPTISEEYDVKNAIIALPSAPHSVRRQIVQICNAADVRVLTVPSFDDLISGKLTISQIRRIELDDLLGRDPVVLDSQGLEGWIGGRTVMVTGAGGSIGSELCRQIARFDPKQLILFELNEFALYKIEQEFHEQFAEIELICAIGDVKNKNRLEQIIKRYSPSVIFHAAAYKHVPLMEDENAWEAILNNVLGTYTVAKAAVDAKLEKFVFISTDKAVNPTNVMGASKRLSEMVCQALQQSGATQFVMVRFGNVLGSAGSVIPKFREQIAKGGPITVTHPEIVRYFMSIPEAAQLVLQAGLMGHGGEVFVMDMGEPVKIVDLARDMIKLSGFSEDDIKITFTGLRPGEKLYEELLMDDEKTVRTPHPKLRIAKVRSSDMKWLEIILKQLNQTQQLSALEVKQILTSHLPEYVCEEILLAKQG